MEKYKLERKIGRGACGVANLYSVIQTGQLVVIKSVNNPFRNGENDMTPEEKQCLREVDIMSTLSHPNIVKFYEYLIINDEMNIVMEYCNSGDLAAMIHHAREKHQMFSEKQIMFWFIQILLAVGYLHELRIIHRDIKPSDFGVTRKLGSSTEYAATVIGTPLYMAPELILSEPYSTKSDVWSLGILLYELCELNTPFSGASILQISTNIINCQIPPLTPNKYNEDMYSLISTMLNKDPATRVSILTIMTCPLITTYLYEFIKEYGNDEILQSIGINTEELLSVSQSEISTNTFTNNKPIAVTSDEKGLLESCCKLCIPFLVTPNSSFDVSNSFNPNASSTDMGSLDESNASEIGKDMFLKSQDTKSSSESTPNPTYSNRISLMKKISIVDPDNLIKPRRKSSSKSPPQNQLTKQQQHELTELQQVHEQLLQYDDSSSNSNSNSIINRPIIDSDSPLSPIQKLQQQEQEKQLQQEILKQEKLQQEIQQQEIQQQLQEEELKKVQQQQQQQLEEQFQKEQQLQHIQEEKQQLEEVEPPQLVIKENEKIEERKEIEVDKEEAKMDYKSDDILSPHSPVKPKDPNSRTISPRPTNFKSPIKTPTVSTKSKSSPISDEHKVYQTVIKPNYENEGFNVNIEEKKNEEYKIDLPMSQYEDIQIPTIKTDEELLLEKQQRIEKRRKRRLQRQNRKNEEIKVEDNEDEDELDISLSPNGQSPSYPLQLIKQQQQQQQSSPTRPSPIKNPLIEVIKKTQLINDHINSSNSDNNSDKNTTKTPSPNDISPRKLNPIKHLSPRLQSNITPITNHLINLSPRIEQQQPPPQSNSSLSMYKSPPSNQRRLPSASSYHSTPSHLPSLQSTPLAIGSSKSTKSLLSHNDEDNKRKKASPIKTADIMMIRGNPLKGIHNSNIDSDIGKIDEYSGDSVIDTENERRFNEEINYITKKPLKKANSFKDYKKKKTRDKNRPYSAPFEAVTAINKIRIEARQVISSLGQR